MANGITDLGNNLGYIYVVQADDITKFISSERNSPQGARNAMLLAAQATSLSLNKRAYGYITVGSVSGAGNVTAITINGVNQIDANIAYNVGPTADVATALAAGINSYTPGSGYDYIAVAISNRVYIYAPIDAADTPNGYTITISDTGNLTTTTVDFNYGSSNTTIYDTSIGFRIYLDANYGSTDAAPGVIGASAIEISNYIIPRGLNVSLDRQSKTIASGVITIARQAAITVLDVETQGGAGTDDLDSIIFADGADGDIIWLRGANATHLVTITTAGNINRVNAFVTATASTQIGLMFFGGSFYEFARSGGNYVPSVSAFRTNNFAFSSYNGRTTSAPADNTTLTLTPNTDDIYNRISGSVSLTTGNYEVFLDDTGAKEGDTFVVDYYGTVTVGSYDVIIGGVTLTDHEALYGGVRLVFVYDDGTGTYLAVGKSYDLSVYPIATANIGTGQVTTAKLATSNQQEIIGPFLVSFETGEQCDNRVKIPYACTLNNVSGAVVKAIAGTDAGTIIAKNAAATVMGTGTITCAASDPLNTTYSVNPSTNNTIAADDVIYFTTSKATVGGKVLVTLKVTRS